jgi:hypothetical protein
LEPVHTGQAVGGSRDSEAATTVRRAEAEKGACRKRKLKAR